jgi:beta-aspartyl-dipeptidase (metallo-type)
MLKLLRNAEVFAPEPQGLRHLLVGGERILWIGETVPELPDSLGVQTWDLGGHRVIPGLIDGHVHITGGGGEGGFRTRVPPLPLSAFTRGGTTTVLGVTGTDDTTRSPGPLLAAARALTEEGMTAYCLTGGYRIPPATLTGSVRDDIVWLDRVIGVGEIAISDHRSAQPTLDELLRVASDAYVAGMLAGKAGLTHLHLGDGERGLDLVRRALDRSELPPRVFFPTHLNRRKDLLEEAFALAARGCTIDVTAFPIEKGEDGRSAAESVRRYLDAGLPGDRITVSTDAGGSLPVFDADGKVVSMDVGRPTALCATLAELLRAGLALETVLPAFTSNVAAVLGLPRKGRIAAGTDADLLVIDGEGAVRDVMARGRWHLRDGSVTVRGTFEREGHMRGDE